MIVVKSDAMLQHEKAIAEVWLTGRDAATIKWCILSKEITGCCYSSISNMQQLPSEET